MEDIRFDGKLDYTIDNIGFVNVMRNKDYTVPFRNGKYKHSLILVSQGEMQYYFPDTDKRIIITRGCALFIPKWYPYIATYTQDDTVAEVLSFDIIADKLPDIFAEPLYKKKSVFSEICQSLSSKNSSGLMYFASKIYEMLYIFEKDSTEIPEKYKKIAPAIYEIHKNYFDNNKVSFYSDMCGMSESNFRKLFKDYTEKSLIEYRNLIRISEAKKMIESGEFTVAEAAYTVGFNNMSFFYEVYNKYIEK